MGTSQGGHKKYLTSDSEQGTEIVGRCPACARRLATKGLRRERRWDCTWWIGTESTTTKKEKTQNKARECAKAKGEISVATSTLPPSMVSKIQEAGSFDIAFR